MGICSVWELPSHSELKNVLLMVELMTYYTISGRMTGQKPKVAFGTDSTHTTWDWRGYITSLWSGSQSPMPLLWYQPECWITACRLRVATPSLAEIWQITSFGWAIPFIFFLSGKVLVGAPCGQASSKVVSVFESSFICCLLKEGQMSLTKNWLSHRQCTGQLHGTNTTVPGQRY